MVSLMTGEEHQGERKFESHRVAEVALRVEGLSAQRTAEHAAGASEIRDVSLVVHRGERLGIAGLVGAGRSELLRLVFGADNPGAGSVEVGDQSGPERFSQPRHAVARGLALVTEERKRDGALLPLPLSANVTLARVPRRGLRLDQQREDAAAAKWCDRLEVRARGIDQPVEQLSGGNQQKVVLAKWLECGAEVLLLDEPTRGIDVAARDKIHALFEELARSGKALVIVSSDLDELMEQCDRIVVLTEGRLVAEFERDSWSRAELLAAAFPAVEASA